MTQLAVDNESVRDLLSQERYTKATEAFAGAAIDTDADWVKQLEVKRTGRLGEVAQEY